jgi:hypothetical protein
MATSVLETGILSNFPITESCRSMTSQCVTRLVSIFPIPGVAPLFHHLHSWLWTDGRDRVLDVR